MNNNSDSSWQPVDQELNQVLELLKESQSTETSVQRKVQQVLNIFHNLVKRAMYII